MVRVDKYGRGSAAVNGVGFVDLAPGDTFAALEEQLKRRIADRFDNLALGISASIGSKRNASELAKHLSAGEEEEVHIYAVEAVEINQDAKSGSTPRGAMSNDLNSAPIRDLTSQLTDKIACYVGDVIRTRPKFVGRRTIYNRTNRRVVVESLVTNR